MIFRCPFIPQFELEMLRERMYDDNFHYNIYAPCATSINKPNHANFFLLFFHQEQSRRPQHSTSPSASRGRPSHGFLSPAPPTPPAPPGMSPSRGRRGGG